MKRFHNLFGAKKDSAIGIGSVKTFHQKLKTERSRTHRNGHMFSLVVLDLEAFHAHKVYLDKIVQTINNRIREIDYIGWYDQNKLGVILPYTSVRGADEFSLNIINSFDDFPNEIERSLITYPPQKHIRC